MDYPEPQKQGEYLTLKVVINGVQDRRKWMRTLTVVSSSHL